MKRLYFLIVAVLLLFSIQIQAGSVKFPSLDQPGTAQATSATNSWTLYNNLLSVEYVLTNGDLFFNGCEELQLAPGSEPFKITLGNGTVVKASDMTMTSSPVISNLTANPDSDKASDRYNGKVLTVKYSYSTLKFVWRAVLRDGSHYIRTELDITATSNTSMKDITPMLYNLTADADVVDVKGTVRGAPLASNKIFAGIENPLGINSVGSESGINNFSLSSWTPESWGTPSSVPSGITSLGFNSSQIVSTEGKVNISSSGSLSVKFQYSTGFHRMNLTGVDIVNESGSVVGKDYHIGYTGDAANKNTYTVSVPSAGKYTLRFFGETKTEEINSSGTITLSGPSVSLATAGSNNIVGRWSRNTTINANETWKIGAVVGLVAEGQLRRSFLAYHERERAVAYRSFIHYNSWYELNIDRNNDSNPLNRMTEEKCVPVLNAWKTNLFDKHGVGIDAFVWDDGWDDFNSLWDFHIGFPNGFSNLNNIATSMGTGIGAWLGPVGGYGSSKQQRLTYWNNNHTNKIDNFELSNPEYFNGFVGSCSNMVNSYDFRYFKFDGISDISNATGPKNEEDAEGILKVLTALREIRYDLFFNCTVGTWSSPFWFQYADAVWRQDGDWDNIGNQGDNREKWITYRDYMVYKNFPTASPICPINSLMTHGLIVTKYGPPAAMPRNDSDATAKGIIREMHCAFGCGSGLIELYVDNDLMSTIGNDGELWKELADCIKWHRENEDVLADVHWVGGNPWDGSKANVYGWASWNGKKSTLTLRNPNSTSKSFSTTLRQALDIPAYVTGNITLTDAFNNQTQYSGITGQSIDIDQTITFNMPAFDVVVLNGSSSQPIEISGNMTISNLNKRVANIKTVHNDLSNLSKGWMQVGLLESWNGKGTLTNEDIANMFTPVATVNGNSIITWSGSGKLSETTLSWENFETQTGNPVVVIMGNGDNIKNAEEIVIYTLKVNNNDLLWEEANGTSVNIGEDNISTIYGEIVEIDGTKYIKTKPFTYPLSVEDQEIDNCKVYVAGNEIIVEGVAENASIKLFDFMGKVVRQTTANGNDAKINISEKGFYLVSIFENNKLVKTEKIIIK